MTKTNSNRSAPVSALMSTKGASVSELRSFFRDDYQYERVIRALVAVKLRANDADRNESVAVGSAVLDLFVFGLEAAAAKAAGYESWHEYETADCLRTIGRLQPRDRPEQNNRNGS